MTTMGLNYLGYQESQRSNLAREGETSRHNVETENLGHLSFGESVRSNKANEGIKQGSLDESVRSNKAREFENFRSNTVNEAERGRSNRAGESISWASVTETQRSNAAREGENVRSNMAKEFENNRSNLADEGIRKYVSDTGNLAKISPTNAFGTIQFSGGIPGYSQGAGQYGYVVDRFVSLLPNMPK